MNNRDKQGKPGFDLVPLALAALVICAIALLLMPAHATSEVSDEIAVTYAAAGDAGYLPAQIANQGRGNEPEIQMYY
jgi:hypothetical protein